MNRLLTVGLLAGSSNDSGDFNVYQTRKTLLQPVARSIAPCANEPDDKDNHHADEVKRQVGMSKVLRLSQGLRAKAG